MDVPEIPLDAVSINDVRLAGEQSLVCGLELGATEEDDPGDSEDSRRRFEDADFVSFFGLCFKVVVGSGGLEVRSELVSGRGGAVWESSRGLSSSLAAV
jgi:hypothetical protein